LSAHSGTRTAGRGLLGSPPFFDYTTHVHTSLHRFLLMLLMLTLPLQGLASASMLGCASSAAQASQAAEPMRMTACHEQAPSDMPPAPHDCKHCAACVLATALPIPISAIPAILPVAIHYLSHPAASFSGFIPDSPERPPRLALA